MGVNHCMRHRDFVPQAHRLPLKIRLIKTKIRLSKIEEDSPWYLLCMQFVMCVVSADFLFQERTFVKFMSNIKQDKLRCFTKALID